MPKLIRFRLTSYAEILLGLDDQALVQQTFPTFKRISALWCEASQSDLVVIQDDCNERSLDVVGGFEHTRAERDVMKRAALSCLQALDQADEDRIAEEARIDNNNRAFRELAEEGTRIIAAQKISEAQAKRAAAAGRPTPPPVKPEDLTAIPLTRKEIIERAKHLADVDRQQRARERREVLS